jgi:hypothetical protein
MLSNQALTIRFAKLLSINIIISLTFCSYGDQLYAWHPDTLLRLGAGLDPSDLTAAKQSPVLSDGVERIDQPSGGVSTSLTSGQILTVRDLLSIMNIDVDTSAHYMMFSGSATLHNYERTSFHSDSRTPDIASREMSAFVSRRLPDCVMQA